MQPAARENAGRHLQAARARERKGRRPEALNKDE